MNMLEKIVKEANEGGLARIEKAVECAENINNITKNYSEHGPEKKTGALEPPTVSAEDIIREMEKDSREQPPVIIEQEDPPYLTEESAPIIESDNEELER